MGPDLYLFALCPSLVVIPYRPVCCLFMNLYVSFFTDKIRQEVSASTPNTGYFISRSENNICSNTMTSFRLHYTTSEVILLLLGCSHTHKYLKRLIFFNNEMSLMAFAARCNKENVTRILLEQLNLIWNVSTSL